MSDTEQALARYKKFFAKRGFTILESRGWHTSRYMDFNSIYECQRNDDYCLNYRNSTYNLIRKNEKRPLYLYEAVTSVKPYSALEALFKKFYEEKLDEIVIRLSEKDFGISDDETPLVQDIDKQYKDENVDEDVFTIVTFRFAAATDTNLKELLEDFIDEAENINYGLAKFGREHTYGMKQPIAGKQLDMFFITFEAKYNNFQFEFADWLYHFTSIDALHSINQKGLLPKSANKNFTYSDRVYLFNNVKFSDIAAFAQEKIEDERLEQLALLRISSKNLQYWKSYQDGITKFYVDTKISNIDMREARAIYTYEAIPRELIDDKVIVYEVDARSMIGNGKEFDLRKF